MQVDNFREEGGKGICCITMTKYLQGLPTIKLDRWDNLLRCSANVIKKMMN